MPPLSTKSNSTSPGITKIGDTHATTVELLVKIEVPGTIIFPAKRQLTPLRGKLFPKTINLVPPVTGPRTGLMRVILGDLKT